MSLELLNFRQFISALLCEPGIESAVYLSTEEMLDTPRSQWRPRWRSILGPLAASARTWGDPEKMLPDGKEAEAFAWLGETRRRARHLRPVEFYADLLSARDGRRRLIARLGQEAIDPIEEFLSLAFTFEETHDDLIKLPKEKS